MIRAMSLRSFLDTLAGSRAAQRTFFDQARRAMLGALARKHPSLPHALLEDAAMQAFEQLWNHRIGAFSSPHPPGSDAFRHDLVRYLAQVIAPRRLVDQLRRTGREVPVADWVPPGDDDLPDDALFDAVLPAGNDGVAAGAERTQLLHRLARCVDHLPAKMHDVVRHVLDDVRQADIAQALGIPEGTVKSRMSEAVKRIKRCMAIGKERS